MKYGRFVLSVVVLSVVLGSPQESFAFGKKRKKPVDPDVQAYPVRLVTMGKVREAKFKLPDGNIVDASVDLAALVQAAASQATTKFAFRAPTPADDLIALDSPGRFVFEGGITAFEADNYEAGIKIGFKSGEGDIGFGSLVDANASLKFKVGILVMDFIVRDRLLGNKIVASGMGNAIPHGGSIGVEVGFEVIKVGSDFVYKTPMYKVFVEAIRKAVHQMVNDPDTNRLMDWTATVMAVNYDLRRVIFSAGVRDEIQPGNVFELRDPEGVYFGELKAREIHADQTFAEVKDDPQGKLLHSVRPGDTVKVRNLGK